VNDPVIGLYNHLGAFEGIPNNFFKGHDAEEQVLGISLMTLFEKQVKVTLARK